MGCTYPRLQIQMLACYACDHSAEESYRTLCMMQSAKAKFKQVAIANEHVFEAPKSYVVGQAPRGLQTGKILQTLRPLKALPLKDEGNFASDLEVLGGGTAIRKGRCIRSTWCLLLEWRLEPSASQAMPTAL